MLPWRASADQKISRGGPAGGRLGVLRSVNKAGRGLGRFFELYVGLDGPKRRGISSEHRNQNLLLRATGIKDLDFEASTPAMVPVLAGGGAVITALALKLWLIFGGMVPFNADEAVVALMARHILRGARPVFFYGQAYMGSLDAFLVAPGFALFGEQIWVMRLLQALLYSGTMVTTIWLGRLVFGSYGSGVVAAWILAIPPVNVTLYTTATLGNYGEALLLGNLILISALRIASQVSAGKAIQSWRWIVWGALVGAGLWAFGLTLVYSFPAACYLLWAVWRGAKDAGRRPLPEAVKWLAAGLLGTLIGSAPWWYFAMESGLAVLLRELTGSAIAGVEGQSGLGLIVQHIFNLLVLGGTVILGLRPPWSVQWLAWPLLPLALAFWLGVLLYTGWRLRPGQSGRSRVWLLAGVMLTLTVGFVITPFGADPSGRYFLPLAVPLSLFAGDLITALHGRLRRRVWLLPLAVIGFNFWGTVQTASQIPPGITTQFDPATQIDQRAMPELIHFLSEKGETRGYTNYWVAFPLSFRSQEELIFAPRLPYHLDFRYTPRDSRYPPYEKIAAASDHTAYITTRNPALDDYLRQAFRRSGIAWQEHVIGDFRVFYRLSAPLQPSDVGLGEIRQ